MKHRGDVFSFAAFSISFAFQVWATEIASPCEGILEYIHQHLPTHGELCSSPNGFVFLKVDDDYAHKCVAEIAKEGFEEPPYFGQLYHTGAHISVIYPEELTNREPLIISELGDTVFFQVRGCQIWETPNFEGIEKVWVVVVDAPFLDRLREKYGFSQEFDFHITIGVKPKAAKSI